MSPAGLGAAAAVLTIAADQASKEWVLGRLAVEGSLGRGQVEVVTGFMNLVPVWNRGVSFGLFAADAQVMRWALTLVAVAVSIGLVIWLRRARHGLLGLGLGLVIGGAIGNAIDRVRHGAVFDFLDLHAAGYHWPAFNVADAGITVGVIALLADGLFGRREGHT
ncbi:MAG: signal peptidase II [Alphaproteobacteria bacterium]